MVIARRNMSVRDVLKTARLRNIKIKASKLHPKTFPKGKWDKGFYREKPPTFLPKPKLPTRPKSTKRLIPKPPRFIKPPTFLPKPTKRLRPKWDKGFYREKPPTFLPKPKLPTKPKSTKRLIPKPPIWLPRFRPPTFLPKPKPRKKKK